MLFCKAFGIACINMSHLSHAMHPCKLPSLLVTALAHVESTL